MISPRAKNELGNRHGCLTVIEEAPSKGRGAEWHCRCDCGGKATIRATSLRRGYNKDCGCGMSGGNRKLKDAMVDIGDPPCDRGCSHRQKCSEEEMACVLYEGWLRFGGEVDPDPANYRPTYSLFWKLFKGAIDE